MALDSDKKYTLHIGTPTAEQVNALRRAGGLTPYGFEALERGLKGTLHGVVIKAGSEIIGMGRLIGDGGCVYQVADIVVHPDHQGRGLGKQIMQALEDYIQANALPGAYINLIADKPADQLYSKFSFQPVGPDALGMERWTPSPSEAPQS